VKRAIYFIFRIIKINVVHISGLTKIKPIYFSIHVIFTVDDTTENHYPIEIYTKYKTLASAASLLLTSLKQRFKQVCKTLINILSLFDLIWCWFCSTTILPLYYASDWNHFCLLILFFFSRSGFIKGEALNWVMNLKIWFFWDSAFFWVKYKDGSNCVFWKWSLFCNRN